MGIFKNLKKIRHKFVFLNKSKKFKTNGFTVIEMLVVLGVTSVLVSIFVVQAGDLRDQISLFKEEARLIQTLFKAKTYSIQVLSEEGGDTACGYGVYLNGFGESEEASYLNFLRKKGADGTCPEDYADLVYDETTKTEILGSEYKIDSKVFIKGVSNNNFVFIPPKPEVVVDGEIRKDGFVFLCLKENTDFCRGIEVNKVGQITSKK